MDCPVCSNSLNKMMAGDVELDVCKNGCGGVWFDWLELKKLDEPHEHAGEEVFQIPIDSSITIDHEKKRQCPKCDDITMMRHFMSVKREVEIDECASCGGVWLDTGELNTIRNQFDTEDARKAHGKAVLDEMFDHEINQVKSNSETKVKSARKVAHALRFICPSYYIPGKQDGGAF